MELTSALHGLAHDAELRAQYMADARAFADRFRLPPEQREALIKLDLQSIVRMGAHPLVPFLAQLQIQRLRPGACSSPSSMPANVARAGTARCMPGLIPRIIFAGHIVRPAASHVG